MTEWIHAILVGGGFGLWSAARAIEKHLQSVEKHLLAEAEAQQKTSEKQSQAKSDAQLKTFDNHYRQSQWKPSSRMVFSKEGPAENRAELIAAANERRKQREQDKMEALRERFRHTLQGHWSNPEVVPYGHAYEFRSDGTGDFRVYSGFGCTEYPLKWRCPEEWVVEFCIDFSMDREANEETGEDEEADEEEWWERVPYDFVIVEGGYGPYVMLCSQVIAAKYREDPHSVKDHDMGLQYYDGGLVFCGNCD